MIDITNKFLVSLSFGQMKIVITKSPEKYHLLTPEDALNLAAYLVLMAESIAPNSFKDILKAIERS